METLEFKTGRHYDGKEQVIKATLYGDMNNFDYFSDSNPDNDPFIIFEDNVRNITGKIILCELNETAIMKNYDNGNYSDDISSCGHEDDCPSGMEDEYNKGF